MLSTFFSIFPRPPTLSSVISMPGKERLQAALLGPRFGGVNEARRDKFLMVEAMRRAGLSSTRQVKTGNWSEARELISTLEQSTSTSTSGAAVVVKPVRGCASGDVFLCRGEDEAKKAFDKILGTPKYGTPGAMNDEVIITNGRLTNPGDECYISSIFLLL